MKINKCKIILFCLLIVLLFQQTYTYATETSSDFLMDGFVHPPQSALPRVYWWWIEGNVTREGITHDLEEMKDKGIGGALLFDAGSSQYKIAKRTPPGPVFLSPEWRELYKHTLKEADRLGLEISLNIQSGWNPGGPMVQPENAMKKLVWSEKRVTGPVNLSEVLPVSQKVKENYYRDVAVQAWRLSESRSKEKRPIKDWAIKSVNGQFRGWKGAYPLHLLREAHPSVAMEEDVKGTGIVNLTENMDKNGRLVWDVPAGEWLILRTGYTLTGAKVSTCSPGWEGLSLDHLSTKALDFYWQAVVTKLIDDAGDLAGKTLKYLHTDSWEMGPVNWTADFPAEFKKRRGYDLRPFLPVMAQKIVDNREISNRFLYDVRRTVADCIAENHYQKFADYSHKYGIGIHPESGGPHSAPIDALQCLGTNDIPMGEFWARAETHRTTDEERLFIKQTASAAHVYGKKLVAAEGFTTIGPHWEKDPWDLKPVFDREACEGLNRLVYCLFTSSPPEYGKPGHEIFAGTHYNPNITWWEQTGVFNDYISRTQFLLQQGLFVADVCYYYGDDVPNFVPLKHVDPALGPGYDYDVVNTDVILNRMTVKDGLIVLPDGMSYRILVLPDWQSMRLDVLRKISELVQAGATVVGNKPVRTPGLTDYPNCDGELKEVADALWGPCDGKMVKENRYGQGRIYWGKKLWEILLSNGVSPDFEYKSRQEGTLWEHFHRRIGDTDIYFVINRNNLYGEAICQFRVENKVPELWDPATGHIQEQVLYKHNKGRITIPMRLDPYGSVFVVFRKTEKKNNVVSLLRNGRDVFAPIGVQVRSIPTAELCRQKDGSLELQAWQPGEYEVKKADGVVEKIVVPTIPEPLEIQGAWKIAFPEGWGAPESVVFDELLSWTESSDPGVKYFSGTATYHKKIRVSTDMLKETRLVLDLGLVRNIAEVRLNGNEMGILWKKPFRVEVTDVIKPGVNELEIEVTNLWPNRLIGDSFLPEKQRYTRTNIQKFHKESPLLESGLLGPVHIFAAIKKNVKL